MSKDAIFVVDMDNNIKFATPACENIFGYTPEEFVNDKELTPRIVHPEYRERFQKFWEEFKRTGRFPEESTEWKWVKKDGNPVYTENTFSNIYDKKGKVVGFITIARDITKRKRAEEDLFKKERFFQALLKNALDFTAVIDEHGKILFHTATVRGFLGYSENELKGKEVFDLIHPDDVDEVKRSFAELVSDHHKVVTKEFRFRHKNGTYRWIESTGLNLLSDPVVKGIVVNSSDVHDRKCAEELLKESERKYRTLAEASQDLIFIIDRNDSVIYANTYAAKWFGIPSEKLIGMQRSELFPKEISERQKKNLDSVFKTGNALYIESDIIYKDRKAYISTWLVPLKNEKGEVESVMGVSRDITSLIELKEKLQSSEALFRGVIENSNEIFTIMNDKGEMRYLSPSIEKIMGFKPEELTNKNAFDFVHPDDAGILLEAIRSVLEKPGKTVTIEVRMKHKDGSWRYIESTGYNLLHDPAIRGIMINSRDITEKKELEKAILESESKFRGLVEKSLVGVYIIQDGLFTYVNPELARIFGYTQDELILNVPVLDLVAEEDRELVRENIRKRINGEVESINYQFKGRKKDGTKIYVEVFGTRTEYKGKPAVIGTLLDITERKRLQEQLFQSQKLEAVGRLAGGIAHDFNNLLTLIMLQSEVIIKQLGENSDVSESIKEIYESAQRASNLTSQLLSFARRQIIEPVVFNVNILIKGINKMLKSLIGEHIKTEIILDENLHPVKVDPAQLEYSIINLVINAKDAMPSGGKLIIETQNVYLDQNYAQTHQDVTPGEYVLIAVSDTGIGMDEDTKSRIFEPFFTTKPAGKGTGLGLATVYGFVKQSGGHIWVYSEKGKGTTFKIYLPVYKEVSEVMSVEKKEPVKLHGIETILLAEDEPSIRELITKILTYYGYKVIEAKDGIDALEKARGYQGDIHLLLTDLIMPRLGGKELYIELKKERPQVEALFISGYTDNVIIHNFIVEEGVNFLQKPFKPEALLKKIRSILDKE